MAEATAEMTAALHYGTAWDGPTTGPTAQAGKHIVVVSLGQAFPTASVFGEAVREAGEAVGWKVAILDGEGEPSKQARALGQAMALKPDGSVLGAVDAKTHLEKLRQATEHGIRIVGWHAAGFPGPDEPLYLFTDLTTHPADIGRLLANYAITDSPGTAAAIIVTDEIYAIAKAKAGATRDRLKQCTGCRVLEYAQAPFSELATQTGPLILSRYRKYAEGGLIPYFLTVANVNYDFGSASLRGAGVGPQAVKFVGSDGEPNAYGRPVHPRDGAPYRVGEHTGSVLGELLGYPVERIEALRGSAVIGTVPPRRHRPGEAGSPGRLGRRAGAVQHHPALHGGLRGPRRAGLRLVPIGRSVMLAYTAPLWVIRRAVLFWRERLTLRRMTGRGRRSSWPALPVQSPRVRLDQPGRNPRQRAGRDATPPGSRSSSALTCTSPPGRSAPTAASSAARSSRSRRTSSACGPWARASSFSMGRSPPAGRAPTASSTRWSRSASLCSRGRARTAVVA